MVDPDKKKLPANERFVMVGALLFRRPRMMGINDLRKGDDDKTMYAGGEKS